MTANDGTYNEAARFSNWLSKQGKEAECDADGLRLLEEFWAEEEAAEQTLTLPLELPERDFAQWKEGGW